MQEINEKKSMSVFLERFALTESKLVLPKGYAGWQLYSPEGKEQSKLTSEAVKALNTGMRKATGELKKWMNKNEVNQGGASMGVAAKFLGKIWGKHVEPVFDDSKYTSTGINDTEPRYIAAQLLIDLIKNYYGISGYTDLGDYL